MDILSVIEPSKEERRFIENISKDFLKRLRKIKGINFIIGGSISKDTWLKGTNEVDLFAKFNYNKFKDKSDKISDFLYKKIGKMFKVNMVHGSRDYFHINYKNIIFEVVPILDIKKPEQALNVTDLSPLHIKFVKKFPKLKNDIRMLKAFCKANFLYGAESYISGFSGYALEVLTIYYKSFKEVLKNAANWRQKKVIDFWEKLKDPMKELNPSKVVSPLILIDPVDKTRNITASLSLKNFDKFISLSKGYLKKPSDTFFVQKKKVPVNTLVIKITPLSGKKDIVGDKIVKTINFILNNLNKEGFSVKKSGWFWEKEVIFWLNPKEKVRNFYIHKGPPENLTNNVIEFKKKHKNVFVKNGFYYAKIKRKITKARDFINKLLKDKYVTDRVKKGELIKWK